MGSNPQGATLCVHKNYRCFIAFCILKHCRNHPKQNETKAIYPQEVIASNMLSAVSLEWQTIKKTEHMKKLLLIAFMALSSLGFAQNSVYIDSVKVLPANPTANDSVFLHIWWWSGYACSPMTPTVVNAGNNHTVNACYLVGVAAVVTGGHDSIFVFQGPAGMHMISWTIMQNGSQSTTCDLFVQGNQQQVNVIATGITESELKPDVEFVQQQFICNTDGMFRVYSTTGQIIYESAATTGKRIAIEAPAGQMYFATLTANDGETTTIKFVMGQ
jgi:hypothetical protein